MSFAGFKVAGMHTVDVNYNPTANFASSSAATASQNVLYASTVKVVSSALSAAIGATVTYTATVAGNATAGIPTGTVTFYDNGVAIPVGQSITLDGNGKATIQISYPAAGTHKITVVYSGDTNYNPSTSAAISEVIKGSTGNRLV